MCTTQEMFHSQLILLKKVMILPLTNIAFIGFLYLIKTDCWTHSINLCIFEISQDNQNCFSVWLSKYAVEL